MQVSITYRSYDHVVSQDFTKVVTVTSTLASVVLLFGEGDIASYGKDSILSFVVSEE